LCLLGVGTLVAVLGTAANPAAAKVKTFSSGTINRAIPDASGKSSFFVEESIVIKKRGRIKDVNAAVRMTHPDSRFVHMELGNVDGALGFASLTTDGFRSLADPKVANFGAGNPDCTGAMTIFDSDAGIPITQGTPPYAGSFAPMSTLDVFDRKQLKGKWRLELGDIQPGDAGVLNCWQITVRYKPQKAKRRLTDG